MTRELLYKIIECLHAVGFNVVAIVSDMGPTNMALWKSLNVTIHQTSFLHPVTKKSLHVFADVPHLLKLIRNHILEQYYSR